MGPYSVLKDYYWRLCEETYLSTSVVLALLYPKHYFLYKSSEFCIVLHPLSVVVVVVVVPIVLLYVQYCIVLVAKIVDRTFVPIVMN